MTILRTLLRKELIDSLRDRRTLMMMILFPVLVYPLLISLIGVLMTAGQARMAREPLTIAVVGEDALAVLASQPTPAHTRYEKFDRASAEQALRDKRVGAVVEAAPGAWRGVQRGEQGTVRVGYTKRYDRSIEALERLRRVLKAASLKTLELRLSEADLPTTFAEPWKTEETDLDFQKDLGPLIASRMLPIILVMMLFMGALYPAIDVTAGEKERGTLETLLVAPVRPMQVMVAKYLTVSIIAAFATLMNLLAMSLTFGVGLRMADGVTATLRFSAAQVCVLLLCLIPAAFMASGVSLAVASLARSFKEAQSLLTPVALAGTVPGLLTLMPGIEFNLGTAAIPLLNVALLVKATALGSVQPGHVVVCLGSVLACSAGTIALAANAFRSESLRFGGIDSWRELFRSHRG